MGSNSPSREYTKERAKYDLVCRGRRRVFGTYAGCCWPLRSVGFETRGFPDANEFFEALKNEKPELILLDVMLPGMDGVEVLQRLKSAPDTCDIPVIMATAKGMEYDKIQSLDLGADDYLVKPFGMMEMVSRVKAVMRRCSHAESPHILKNGGIMLDTSAHTVSVDGEKIQLTLQGIRNTKAVFVTSSDSFHPRAAFQRGLGTELCWRDKNG